MMSGSCDCVKILRTMRRSWVDGIFTSKVWGGSWCSEHQKQRRPSEKYVQMSGLGEVTLMTLEVTALQSMMNAKLTKGCFYPVIRLGLSQHFFDWFSANCVFGFAETLSFLLEFWGIFMRLHFFSSGPKKPVLPTPLFASSILSKHRRP